MIVEFGLNERDIGIFIAITTAVGGTMQLAYGFLTRIVARAHRSSAAASSYSGSGSC